MVRRTITAAPTPIKRGGSAKWRSTRIGTVRPAAGRGPFGDIGAADAAARPVSIGGAVGDLARPAACRLAGALLQLPTLVPAAAEPHDGDHGDEEKELPEA